MNAVVILIITLIDIYLWIVIANVIFSWLVTFNVINVHSRFVAMVGEFLYRATEPVLGRIRRILPVMGGFDFSPVILILGLWFLQNLIVRDIYPAIAQ